jgi:hypothetical protein
MKFRLVVCLGGGDNRKLGRCNRDFVSGMIGGGIVEYVNKEGWLVSDRLYKRVK